MWFQVLNRHERKNSTTFHLLLLRFIRLDPSKGRNRHPITTTHKNVSKGHPGTSPPGQARFKGPTRFTVCPGMVGKREYLATTSWRVLRTMAISGESLRMEGLSTPLCMRGDVPFRVYTPTNSCQNEGPTWVLRLWRQAGIDCEAYAPPTHSSWQECLELKLYRLWG